MIEKSYTLDQIIHDEKQIRNVEELEVGKVYKCMNCSPGYLGGDIGSRGILEIVSIGDRTMKVIRTFGDTSFEQEEFLEDFGIIPNVGDDGKQRWNKRNWLVPVGED